MSGDDLRVRLLALCGLLVASGDMTPYAKLKIEQALAEPDGGRPS